MELVVAETATRFQGRAQRVKSEGYGSERPSRGNVIIHLA